MIDEAENFLRRIQLVDKRVRDVTAFIKKRDGVKAVLVMEETEFMRGIGRFVGLCHG